MDDEDALVLERLLRRRYSCRAFRPETLPNAVVNRLFEMAQRTASWCNTQPWQVIVTSGNATERFRTALYEAVATQEPEIGPTAADRIPGDLSGSAPPVRLRSVRRAEHPADGCGGPKQTGAGELPVLRCAR